MSFNYPDTDGVLWFNDGFQGNRLNTLCILGKKYYERFNYIYHPDYISLYCDEEQTNVARNMNKMVDLVIKNREVEFEQKNYNT